MAIYSFSMRFLERVSRGVGVGAPLIWASTVGKEYTTIRIQCGIVVWKNTGLVMAMVILDR